MSSVADEEMVYVWLIRAFVGLADNVSVGNVADIFKSCQENEMDGFMNFIWACL